MDHVAVRNIDDLDGEFVLLIPDENGRFSVLLKTMIAGREETVEITGKITIASILIEFDSLPVPLQVDIHFVPDIDGMALDLTDGMDRIVNISNTSERTVGSLPRTGVKSVIALMILGLVTSLTAAAAIVTVIIWQNKKEKKVRVFFRMIY